MDLNQKKLISILTFLGVLSAIVGPHFLATALSLIPMILIILLFFKMGNPIFITIFLALVFQWFQINIKIVNGNLFNIPIDEQFSFYQYVDFLYLANILSNIGLCFFSIGIYWPLAKKFKDFNVINLLDESYSTRRILRSYILFSIGISVLFVLKGVIPGLNSIVVAFVKLKWGLLLITLVYSLIYGEKRQLLYLVVGIEILLGFTGYFSAFKDFIIIIVLAILTIRVELGTKALIRFSFISVLLLGFGLMWTAIKIDFREYLSGGTETQTVVVSKTDAINKFFDEISGVSFEDMSLASDALLDRISYIEFFSIVLKVVPEYIPHQNGEIIEESVSFYLKPRIFFPNKPVIDDSDHTNKFTTLELADDGKASHSIGFMTDAYIDFGPFGMMGLLLILGSVFGWSMRILIVRSPNIVWAIIFIIPFYFLLSVYSFNMMKVIGNFVTYIIPVYFFRNYAYKLFDRYLRYKGVP
ncbi:hypothetical protein M0G43_06540 [Subsaxibacter sp. CAU 1640]|uniref:hypothetical protein n=1 Tax=Subsaxibacter sp. CAU 1640 TaxID=2933271 RepID=UPI002003BA0B|nr:hypothetical protein [Subsaxibacter sp. CAU 1640]MCK7590223.1 hypothetical protein [Subsaxibacter sp. CAU 1640]